MSFNEGRTVDNFVNVFPKNLESSFFWKKERICGEPFLVKIDSFTQQEVDYMIADY